MTTAGIMLTIAIMSTPMIVMMTVPMITTIAIVAIIGGGARMASMIAAAVPRPPQSAVQA